MKKDAASRFRTLLCLVFLALQSFVAVAQPKEPAPLPSAAQEALNKGIIAAKVPDYLLAISYFDEARRLAPQAPVVYLNMGLAESKIAGRELRAIAWFGAYLAAYPDAPNAAAVKEQIAVLEVRNQSNVLRLLKTIQEEVGNQALDEAQDNMRKMVQLWAGTGEVTAAIETADVYIKKNSDSKPTTLAYWKNWARSQIASTQAGAGDIAGALKTADLIQVAYPYFKSHAQSGIAEAQIRTADVAEAHKTIAFALKNADLIEDPYYKNHALSAIAKVQVKAGDIAGAQKATDLIQDAKYKSQAQKLIAEAQARAVITKAPNSIRQLTADAKPAVQPVITASDWLKKLDDDNKSNDCSLNTSPFLNLAGHLKSLPASSDPQKIFDALHETASKIVTAQNIINGMLKQQAKR